MGQSRSGLPDGIATVDLAVMRRVEHSDSRLLDLVMPRLSRLADHGVLWTGLAFALWATGDRWARRAAWRGIGSLLAASAVANIAGKGLTARGRPEIRVPPARRLPRTPQTMSFPFGHAASAAAFATGVTLEKPDLAVPVIMLAAAVGASRVVTGVHYPSDVLAGFAVGTAAGAVTLRWWPRRPPADDLGVWSVDDALAALRAGEAVLEDIGVVGQRSFINTSSTGIYVDLVHARRRLDHALGRRVAAVAALIQVLRRGRPHELILSGRRLRLWLYFAGNCRYEPTGTAPAYRPDLCDGYLDIRVVEPGLLARSRLVAAVLTGTVRWCRVYSEWLAREVTIASAGGVPVWLSVDGEVATAEPGFTQAKRPHGLLVYRPTGNPADGMPPAAPLWLRKLCRHALT